VDGINGLSGINGGLHDAVALTDGGACCFSIIGIAARDVKADHAVMRRQLIGAAAAADVVRDGLGAGQVDLDDAFGVDPGGAEGVVRGDGVSGDDRVDTIGCNLRGDFFDRHLSGGSGDRNAVSSGVNDVGHGSAEDGDG
jgi:hypothetical protein